jgi:hypothetical protein
MLRPAGRRRARAPGRAVADAGPPLIGNSLPPCEGTVHDATMQRFGRSSVDEVTGMVRRANCQRWIVVAVLLLAIQATLSPGLA